MCTFTLHMDTFSQIVWCDIVPACASHVVMGSPRCNYNKFEYCFSYHFFPNKKKYSSSSLLNNHITVHKLKDDFKFPHDFKETFDIMIKQFDNLISKLQQQPPSSQV